MIRIGMLTSGGDCQALNAAMRGVAKTLYNSNEEVEIYGFLNGYQGLIHGRFRLLNYDDFSGILTKGGTSHQGRHVPRLQPHPVQDHPGHRGRRHRQGGRHEADLL